MSTLTKDSKVVLKLDLGAKAISYKQATIIGARKAVVSSFGRVLFYIVHKVVIRMIEFVLKLTVKILKSSTLYGGMQCIVYPHLLYCIVLYCVCT